MFSGSNKDVSDADFLVKVDALVNSCGA